MTPTTLQYGAIEAGGTKFVCAVGTSPDDLHDITRFPTTTPTQTIGQAIAFLRDRLPLSAVGIASFGPIDLNSTSLTFGYITSTPKPGWRNTDLRGMVNRALHIPVGFDTDVNVAALGEHRWGAAQGLNTFIYLTIGTGIGGGGMVSGKLMHGLVHPEMGHIRIPHDWKADPFPGVCPFHGDCFEGLAAGPAIEQRWGKRGEDLPIEHPAWALEANYIALALNNYICTLSPQRIILGGGVMQRVWLFPLVREQVQRLLSNYIQAPDITAQINQFIVPPGLGEQSGVLGAIALAQQR